MIVIAILATLALIGAVAAGIVTAWREADILLGLAVGVIGLAGALILAIAAAGVWGLWTAALA